MFLTRRDLNLEPRVYGFHLSTGFCMWRIYGFNVWAFLVDVLDFVIVLFQSGVFEYVLFCVRVVVLVDVLGFVMVLFQSCVIEHVLFCVCVVVAICVCIG